MMVSYEERMAQVAQTTAFREKWGGVIHPNYKAGDDLASNKFVGTASQKDVIESLISGGNAGNLPIWLEENKIDVGGLENVYSASVWNTPIKQTALRAQLAAETQRLGSPETTLVKSTAQAFTNFNLPSAARSRQTPIKQNDVLPPIIPEPIREIKQNTGRNETPSEIKSQAATMQIETIPIEETTIETKSNNSKYFIIGGFAIAALVLFLILRRRK